MTTREFIDCITGGLWADNSELSELLAKHKAIVWKDILLLRKQAPSSEDSTMWAVCAYAVNTGLDKEQLYQLVNILTDTALWDKIRRKYDEEYVEYGFLSVEDGGRGERFEM
jgi:hypothetical protein